MCVLLDNVSDNRIDVLPARKCFIRVLFLCFFFPTPNMGIDGGFNSGIQARKGCHVLALVFYLSDGRDQAARGLGLVDLVDGQRITCTLFG